LNAKRPDIAELIYLRLRTFAISEYRGKQFPGKGSKVGVRIARRIFVTRNNEITRETKLNWELWRRRIDPLDLVDSKGSPNAMYKEFLHAMTMALVPHGGALIPRETTIRSFITYHCHYTGCMQDVAFYLKEMEIFKIEASYGVYVDLLHGFFLWHERNGQWNSERLDNVFAL